MSEQLLVATPGEVLRIDAKTGRIERGKWPTGRRPTGLAGDPWNPGRAWCSTTAGVLRSDDAGRTWSPAGLDDARLMTVAVSPARPGRVWAGGDPTAIWRSDDEGRTWTRIEGLFELPSSSTWAFPPKPETNHVRWLLPHATNADIVWAAIEAGALIRTLDAGATWLDRVPGGPYDTHELSAHPRQPFLLRSAAGDGYFESSDGGTSWSSPMEGLEVRYLRSVAIDCGDPRTVLVSGASGPRSAYVSGRSDGRLYRKSGGGPWTRVLRGWPTEPRTIAPLLLAGTEPGAFWAADDRGVHRSDDGGRAWRAAAEFERSPDHLRGIALV